jgi:hypothetical protein
MAGTRLRMLWVRLRMLVYFIRYMSPGSIHLDHNIRKFGYPRPFCMGGGGAFGHDVP